MFFLSASVQVSDAVKRLKCNPQKERYKLKQTTKQKWLQCVTKSALNKPITIIDGLGDVLKEQKAIGRNLNQLTTLCNMGKIECPDLSEMINRYSAVYDCLNDISERCS